VLAPPFASALAQESARIATVGFLLMTTGPDNDSVLAIVRWKLAELGYVEGQNIRFEYRGANGQVDRLPSLAEELVHLNVDVIVAVATPEVQAAQQATRKIPIVMVAVVDPVATGFVASLARPGGNITGLSLLSAELSGKRLELLKEVVPGVSRVAVLWNPTNPSNVLQLGATKAAAQALGVQLHPLEVRGPQDVESAFQAATRGRAGALIALDDPLIITYRTRIVALAAKNRLPAMYGLTGYAKAGGLITYGPNIPDLFRQAAVFVGKILKGAKPTDLPVEQPTKFELVINLKTAKALGLAIPESILLRADEVIR
jgi:putative tryptophan/tyrosine transport system substrate-binding protein